jgi:hypothetical protein
LGPWHDAVRGRAPDWGRGDLDAPPDGADAVLDAGQARARRHGSLVKATPGVADGERQLVRLAFQPDRHGGVRAGVLGGVLDQLEAAEVDRDLDPWFAEADTGRRDADRDRAVRGLGPERLGESALGQERRRDAVRDPAQLRADGDRVLAQCGERRREIRRALRRPLLRQAEPDL